MMTPALLGALLIAAALAELLLPGRALYHTGWFNVALVAAIIVMAAGIPKPLRALPSGRARAAVIAAAFFAAMTGFAAIASGLLGPDEHTVVAAPGETVRMDELGGALAFPLANAGAVQSAVALRRGDAATSIGARRIVGSFLLEPVSRPVVAIDAGDARGAHLTVTQPTGASFLSPVLLMQGRQSIDGMNVPYDSFDVPAVHRTVKIVLFSSDQTAHLPGLDGSQPAVLFDVENANGAELHGGIGVAVSGRRVVLGGLSLRPTIFDYPAIRIVSVPNLTITVVASLLAVVAAAFAVAEACRAKTRSPAA